jgi:DNA (cytosine-5)-methyltransferase 1
MNYYNEHDPKAADWLRELIKARFIPNGDVDERGIEDVLPSDLAGYTQCHFFAGIGGWSLALELAGWPEDRPVWTGSCPCQPFSVAGKGRGTEDERHLWPVFAELIRACKPPVVFGEQVASKAGRDWLAGVFADLEGMAYNRAGADLCAAGVGAPHIRQRLYWVAHSDSERYHGQHSLLRKDQRGWNTGDFSKAPRSGKTSGLANLHGTGLEEWEEQFAQEERQAVVGSGDAGHWAGSKLIQCRDGKTRRVPTEPAFFPLANGVSSARMGILRGAGNAIVPQVAAEFVASYLDATS